MKSGDGSLSLWERAGVRVSTMKKLSLSDGLAF